MAPWWSDVVSSTLTKSSIGNVARRGLGEGRVMLDTRRVVALSSTVVASIEGLPRVFASIYILQMTWRMTEATSRACAWDGIS
jgi:hypothetical protein